MTIAALVAMVLFCGAGAAQTIAGDASFDVAQMETVDMAPDNPGIWMFHCHIDDHMNDGMVTLYKVEP